MSYVRKKEEKSFVKGTNEDFFINSYSCISKFSKIRVLEIKSKYNINVLFY